MSDNPDNSDVTTPREIPRSPVLNIKRGKGHLPKTGKGETPTEVRHSKHKAPGMLYVISEKARAIRIGRGIGIREMGRILFDEKYPIHWRTYDSFCNVWGKIELGKKPAPVKRESVESVAKVLGVNVYEIAQDGVIIAPEMVAKCSPKELDQIMKGQRHAKTGKILRVSDMPWEDRPKIVTINGISWQPIPGVKYKHDYWQIYQNVMQKKEGWHEEGTYRWLFQHDLFFLVFFGLRWPGANHEFIVNCCREIEDGPQTRTLDLWFREGGKSTIITTARSIQEVLNNPNERVGIFSYTRSAAIALLRQIRWVLEESEILKTCFPDILYANPDKESPKWSDLEGLVVRRSGYHKELTFEAHGLIDGMPTGKHFSLLVYDDVVTADLVQTPEMMSKVKERFDLSLNIGTATGRHRVIGTIYDYDDALMYIASKRNSLTGEPTYHVRKKAATIDGTFGGASVFLPEERLDLLRANRKIFACQQLLDPSPTGEGLFRGDMLNIVDRQDIPTRLYKFMVVDPAGTNAMRVDNRKADKWAAWVVGVSPNLTDKGVSNLYILDGFLQSMSMGDALREITRLYLRSGRILKMGVEKVGGMTFEVHIANALREKGKLLSTDIGNLVLLTPGGRKKERRIEEALAWPFANGCIHISTQVPANVREDLRMEMERFGGGWKDDGLDALSYVYDILSEYRFNRIEDMDDTRRDMYERERLYSSKSVINTNNNWMRA